MTEAWSLPPELGWPQFLRLLRRPDPPKGWLEAAAQVEDVRKRPELLRWIAQHPKAPAHLRATLLPRLTWKALAQVAQDATAHPQARTFALDKLQMQWPSLSLGIRRSLALLAPPPLWPLVWKVRDTQVLANLLLHPRLSLEALLNLVQPPLQGPQAEALLASRWSTLPPLAHQALLALDASLQLPETSVVLGMAAPWILALEAEARLETSTHLTHPALRRMVRGRMSAPHQASEETP